jgi:hypothetical protein
MSLNKAIEHHKEHRKPYYRAASVSHSCRPHGGCPYCFNNRYHRNFVALIAAEDEIKFALDILENDDIIE